MERVHLRLRSADARARSTRRERRTATRADCEHWSMAPRAERCLAVAPLTSGQSAFEDRESEENSGETLLAILLLFNSARIFLSR